MLGRVAPLLFAFVLAAGCSSSEANDAGTPPVDAGLDAGAPDTATANDTGDAGDTAMADTAPADTGAVDSSSDADADADADAGGAGDAASCNDLAFGAAAAIYISVPASSLGTLTGGAIVDGTYDLVSVETSSTSIPASYAMQSTWRFAGATLDQVDQLKTSTLGPLTHRTGSISVSGATITRSYTCGSTDATPAALNYDSKVVSGIQTVRISTSALRLTFEKRP